jgi:tagatose 6-phosphate kinase
MPGDEVIVVVGVSPAWQRTLRFDRFQPGEVNRARRVRETASGKGVNVARVAATLGAKVRLVTIAGGHRGRLLTRALRNEKFDVNALRVAAETRICQTLIAGDRATELVEEPGGLTRREVAELTALIARQLQPARVLVLTGSVPPGCGEDFYARLIRHARARGIRTLVDAQGGPLRNAAAARPSLVRVNRAELAAAVGAPPTASTRAIESAARRLLDEGVGALVVSAGPGQVLAFAAGARWALSPPRIRPVNPIGSGDAMLAGIACGLWRERPLEQAIRHGIACAAANALTPTPGVVRLADLRRLSAR